MYCNSSKTVVIIFFLAVVYCQVCCSLPNRENCTEQCLCLFDSNELSLVTCNGRNANSSEHVFDIQLSKLLAEFPSSEALKVTLKDFQPKYYESSTSFNKHDSITSLSMTSCHLNSVLASQITEHMSHVSFLNFSRNALASFELKGTFQYLRSLDLSYNQLSSDNFSIKRLQFPLLKEIYLQGNELTSWNVYNSSKVALLDLSNNPLKDICILDNIRIPSPEEIVLQSVSVIYQHHMSSNCKSPFPSSIRKVNLQYNQLLHVPRCDSYFQNLKLLKLDIRNNYITSVGVNAFNSSCYSNLEILMLDGNGLFTIDGNFNQHLNLEYLSISNNMLQHFSEDILQNFNTNSATSENAIILNNNPWSCDCMQKNVKSFLEEIQSFSSLGMVCQYPEHFQGSDITTILSDDMICLAPSDLNVAVFNESAHEYEDGKLSCFFESIPRSSVTWITPDGKNISHSTTKYTLQNGGNTLIVHDVHLGDTGFYTCAGENVMGAANATITLTVILSSGSTIVLVCASCVAFVVAVVINFIHFTSYILERIEQKRQYKLLIKKQLEEYKLNPPVSSRHKHLDESIVSLNAYRYYSKYDYNCQQLFLDSVLKGAQTVKKTLYDARHIDVGGNIRGYATNLKERLHIEIPTSMPSLSMPNYRMPTMPTFQNINTNIERIGTSMVQTSQNIALSVGSVLSLKRWMAQPQTSTDSSTDDIPTDAESEENSPCLQRVEVTVHNHAPSLNGEDPSWMNNRTDDVITNSTDLDDVINTDEVTAPLTIPLQLTDGSITYPEQGSQNDTSEDIPDFYDVTSGLSSDAYQVSLHPTEELNSENESNFDERPPPSNNRTYVSYETTL